ncbi:hypothetical protein M3Y96_00639100 [Aphelenchoides besseyi]|nr:hypothetical protein M3Y96_00639100 [Aphelenchoides besseyi]
MACSLCSKRFCLRCLWAIHSRDQHGIDGIEEELLDQSQYLKRLDRARQSYAANPEPTRERARQSYAANPEPTRERARQSYAANPEPTRERARQSYAANLESNRERARKRATNAKKIAEENADPALKAASDAYYAQINKMNARNKLIWETHKANRTSRDPLLRILAEKFYEKRSETNRKYDAKRRAKR